MMELSTIGEYNCLHTIRSDRFTNQRVKQKLPRKIFGFAKLWTCDTFSTFEKKMRVFECNKVVLLFCAVFVLESDVRRWCNAAIGE